MMDRTGNIASRTLGFVITVVLLLFAPPSSARAIYFERADVHQTGGEPQAVAIGDVTSDGRADVLLSTRSYNDPENDNKLFLFEQAEDGTLHEVQKLDHGGAIGGPVIGDFDSDGDDDAAIGTYAGVRLFTQEGGTLAPHVALPGAPAVAGPVEADDVNADGAADLVLNSATGVSALVQGSGGFSVVPVSPLVAESVATGDVIGDEQSDVVVVSSYDQPNALRVYEQQDTGGYVERSMPLSFDEDPNQVAVADVTGDGLEDIVVTRGGHSPDAHLAVYRQTDEGTIDPTPDVYDSYEIPEAVKTLDINGDGLEDVAVGHVGWGRIGVYLQGPDGYLYEEDLIPGWVNWGADTIALGDVSSDGRADLALAWYGGSLVVRRQKLPFELSSAGHVDGRITATWTRPAGMNSEFIEVATSPETYPDGRLADLFLDSNIVLYDDWLQRDQESYLASEPLPPGIYHVHVRVWDDEVCFQPDQWNCPDEVSATSVVTVPAGAAAGTAAAAAPPADKVVRFASLRAAARQSVRKLAVTASIPEAGTITAGGTVTVPNASQTYRLRPASTSAAAGATVTLRPKLSKEARRGVVRALRRKKRVVAKITVTARDRAGNTQTVKRTIRLTR